MLGVILIILALIWLVVISLTNIDMTEIRLLVTYWKEYLAIVIMMISAYLLNN